MKRLLIIVFFILLVLLTSSCIINKHYYEYYETYLPDINEYEKLEVTVNQINTSIIASYTDCILYNNEFVESKAKKFIVAIITTSLYVLFVVASVLINLL